MPPYHPSGDASAPPPPGGRARRGRGTPAVAARRPASPSESVPDGSAPDAVASASRTLTCALAHLRTCVTRLAEHRRAAGAPVEQVVAEVEHLVREAERRELWRDASRGLLTQAVRWAVGAYREPPRV
jgi:hypothetical protein